MTVTGCECAKKPAAPTQLNEGEACENDERCSTGLCDAAPGFTPVCVRRCGDGCLPTEVCVQLTPNRFACQPDQRKLCAPCVADTDCPYPSDHCIVVNGENVCGRDCAFDQSCPTGYRCVNAVGVDGLPKVQQCVPINASCACLARGDFQQPCQTTNALGTCNGIKQCDLVSNDVVCDAPEAQAETCNGKDDDCDGRIDEDQMTASCGVGACERTASSCVDGGVASCTPGMPTAETCNGIDDDCDGTRDNGFDTMTDVAHCGMCNRPCALANATPVCTAGACQVGTCNAGFGNCDGQHPNGCEVNTTNDAMHCGGCGQTCTRPNSTATCVNSMCQFVCAAGWIDLNQDPADGCEYQCTPTSTTDLPDLNFVDANCDGIDGELNNGVFVSTGGDDANPGTRAAPKQTLAAAMTAVVTTGKRDVYVAAGSYTGPLELLGASGINVAGAYHPMTWQRNFTNQVAVQNGNPALRLDGASNVLIQALRLEGSNGTPSAPTAYGAFIKESSAVKLESLDIRAGNGAPGTAGTAGTPGRNGAPGGNGEEGCAQDARGGDFAAFCNFGLFVNSCGGQRPIAGAGGNSGGLSCGYPGGGGGQPSKQTSPNDQLSSVVPGDNGAAAPAGTGLAGIGAPESTSPTGAPYFGGNGQSGTGGTNGAGASAGTFGANGFIPSSGGTGTPGTPGRGGGGGGGGAGGWIPWTGIGVGNPCQGYGSAGGGGGEGACGGASGGGGSGGGASIGIFLFNAQVSAQGVVTRAGNGGNGGAGGNGGSGGTGGAGGTSPNPPDSSRATRGGNGGRGGDGGPGGHGGGGAGGSVYGLAKNSGSTWTPISGTSFMIGTPGAAGTSPGNAGAPGASGVQTTF
ncbi:MAG: MopE-related protein [Myxococcota bacterium]